MDVRSACRLPVESLLWRPSADSWALTVVCKATFSWSGSELELAEHQEPPTPADLHWDGDEARSLRAASDLVPIKPRVDVVLVGSAFAPGAAPVQRLSARLAVGALDKTIEIVGDPRPERGNQPGAEWGSFVEMPLVYERASGSSTANPVGAGLDAAGGDGSGRQATLYLQHSSLATAAQPAGAAFGPIAPSWPLRRHKLGPHAGSWQLSDLRTQPIPAELDLGFFNHAPPDQQLDRLPDGARVVLENLDREAPLIELRLPMLRPWLTVERQGSFVDEATAEELPTMRCDTLTIDTDRSVMTLVWRTQIALERADESGRVLVSLDPLGTSLVAQSARRRSVPPPPVSTGLPFRRPGPPASAPTPPSGRATPPPAVPPPAVPQPVVPPPAVAQPVVPPPAVPRAVPVSAPTATAVPAPVAPPVAAPSVPPPPAQSVASPVGSAWSPPRASYRPPVEPLVERGASPWVPPEQRGTDGTYAQTIGQQVAGPVESPKPVPAPSSEPAPQPRKLAALERGEVLQLTWFDPVVLPRVRRNAEYAELLAALEHRAREPQLEDAFPDETPASVEDRRDLFEVLARAPALGDDRWAAALASATLVGGRYVPPIVLVAGELALSFDELATLRSTVSIATPLIGADEALKRAVQDARDFLALPDLLSPASVVEGFTSRIVEAFRKLKRGLPASYLESHAERAVLERRLYQKRELHGAPHLRAALYLGGTTRPVPAYLPELLSTKLPLYPRFRVRLLAELHLSEDPLDAHEASLRVVALGRVLSLAQEASGPLPR